MGGSGGRGVLGWRWWRCRCQVPCLLGLYLVAFLLGTALWRCRRRSCAGLELRCPGGVMAVPAALIALINQDVPLFWGGGSLWCLFGLPVPRFGYLAAAFHPPVADGPFHKQHRRCCQMCPRTRTCQCQCVLADRDIIIHLSSATSNSQPTHRHFFLFRFTAKGKRLSLAPLRFFVFFLLQVIPFQRSNNIPLSFCCALR